jgi:hypothetical protein
MHYFFFFGTPWKCIDLTCIFSVISKLTEEKKPFWHYNDMILMNIYHWQDFLMLDQSIRKYNLGYGQECPLLALHGLQTSTYPHHSELYQCQESYPCRLPNQLPTNKKWNRKNYRKFWELLYKQPCRTLLILNEESSAFIENLRLS